MYKHAIALMTVITLSGCSMDISGLIIGLKPKTTNKPITTEIKPENDRGRAVSFSETSNASLTIRGITTVTDPVKIAFAGVDENWKIRRFLPVTNFEASDVPEGVIPIFVTKALLGTDLYTKVPDRQSATFVWFMPKPVLFDAQTVSARMGSTDGSLLPVPQTIGTEGGTSATNASAFLFQFPVNASGDFEVNLGSRYAYVSWDRQSDQMNISPKLVFRDYIGSTQPASISIDFDLTDSNGSPIYGLTRSDFDYSIKSPPRTFFCDESFREIATGSYRLELAGSKLADQPTPVQVKLVLPNFTSSAELAQTL